MSPQSPPFPKLAERSDSLAAFASSGHGPQVLHTLEEVSPTSPHVYAPFARWVKETYSPDCQVYHRRDSTRSETLMIRTPWVARLNTVTAMDPDDLIMCAKRQLRESYIAFAGKAREVASPESLDTFTAWLHTTIRKEVEENPHCKHYEGEMAVHITSAFSAPRVVEVVLKLYLFAPSGRQHRWMGETLSECLTKARADIESWMAAEAQLEAGL